MNLSHNEFQFLMRRDLMTFIERSFYELNPQTTFSKSPHIEHWHPGLRLADKARPSA
jgi:hypothetical protein